MDLLGGSGLKMTCKVKHGIHSPCYLSKSNDLGGVEKLLFLLAGEWFLQRDITRCPSNKVLFSNLGVEADRLKDFKLKRLVFLE